MQQTSSSVAEIVNKNVSASAAAGIKKAEVEMHKIGSALLAGDPLPYGAYNITLAAFAITTNALAKGNT